LSIANKIENKLNQINKACILYFTTQLESEKHFSSQKRKQNAVQQALFEKTLSEIQQSGLSYVISDGKTYGESFGERIKGAVSAIFQLGYQNLIIVGDDTPNLSASNLLEAQKNLETKILTIGPSYDGGSYLMSLNKEYFELGVLENLEWQSRNFYHQLTANLEQLNLQYQLLQTFIDLDDWASISSFLNQSKYSSFQKILAAIFSEGAPNAVEYLFKEDNYTSHNTDRGPPIVV
jgi:glycosyltransferase A (GT-A) superfamily protein (DUF2064 family)